MWSGNSTLGVVLTAGAPPADVMGVDALGIDEAESLATLGTAAERTWRLVVTCSLVRPSFF